MCMKWHNRFIATVVSAAIALTVFSARPGRADENALRALAAIAGVAIVGAMIRDAARAPGGESSPVSRSFSPRSPRRVDAPGARTLAPYRSVRPVAGPPAIYDTSPLLGLTPRPLPERVRNASRRLLPGDCLRSAGTRGGQLHYVTQRCLQQRGVTDTKQLPQACALRVATQKPARKGYDAACLQRAGYRLTRR